MAYLKSKEPFNIIPSDIILTYKTIELKYLKDKNYFVKVKKQSGLNKFSKPVFSNEEHDAYLKRKNRRDNIDNKNYSERKTRSQSPSQKPNRTFTAEETAAYLERKNRRDRSQRHERKQKDMPDRSQSHERKPNRMFTTEETAAYLERKNRRDRSQSPERKTGGFKKNSNDKILVYC